MLARSTLALFATLAASIHGQRVLVVDAAGGGSFATIQSAIDAAIAGDTVLVRPGEYDGATVTKGVHLLGDGAGFRVRSPLSVHGLPANETCRIVGVSTPPAAIPPIDIRNCAGPVWIEDCDLRVNTLFSPSVVWLEDAAAVTLMRVRVESTGSLQGYAPRAVTATRSSLFAFETTIVGGPSRSRFSTTGGTGLFVTDSFVFLQGGSVQGGDGVTPYTCFAPGDGGVGVNASGATEIVVRGTPIAGGAPGVSQTPGCGQAMGNPGTATLLSGAATLRTLPGAPLRMAAVPIAREGDAVNYTIDGPPGTALALGLALAPAPLWFAPLDLPLSLGAAFTAIPVGAIPPSGTRIVPTAAPMLLPGVDSQTLFVQAFGINATSGVIGGTGQAVTTLDARF